MNAVTSIMGATGGVVNTGAVCAQLINVSSAQLKKDNFLKKDMIFFMFNSITIIMYDFFG